MDEFKDLGSLSETEFASLVNTIAANPNRHHELTELLREDHTLYDQRGAAMIVRMRGWLLHTLSRVGVSDEALIFILEELDTGADPYLVAAAARALRSYPNPTSSLAPFVMRAMTNIRYRNEPVSFERYGEYAAEGTSTSPVHELILTLEWLGPLARHVLPELEALLEQPGRFSKRLVIDLERAAKAIREADEVSDSCCALPRGLRDRFSWVSGSRRSSKSVESVVFDDQDNQPITFCEFFSGQPAIAVFFYTRCDNPLKCSLTITKLGRIQKLLHENGLSEDIKTAAITYDPDFDLPDRIRGYGENRGLKMGPHHRMLRARDGLGSIRKHFKLGVNFIESLVNRHRVEVFILDANGEIASVFERIHWDEQQVVDRAVEVLHEKDAPSAPLLPSHFDKGKTATPLLGTLASVGLAFFPKCPICWAAYLSVFGIAGLDQIPYSPWLQPVLATVMVINLGSVWLRARSTGRMIAFYLVSAGAIAIIISKLGHQSTSLAFWGVGLSIIGSALSALKARTRKFKSVPLKT